MIENIEKVEFMRPELSVEDLAYALHQANLKLLETNRKLKESEKKRYELLANISHDLRSPITTLRGYTEYLLSFEQLDEQEVFTTLKQMYQKFLSLDYLLNELLLFTKLEATELPVNLTPVPIRDYLQAFFDSCKTDMKYSQRRLSLKLPKDFPYYVQLNSEMFARAMDNLFINALKYSSRNDEITLEAYYQQQEIIISVSDTGIGIDSKYIPFLFDRTYMISASRTPEQLKGCGLGLSIASDIIKKHRGEIWCNSILGKGSTFYISLPIYSETDTKQ